MVSNEIAVLGSNGFIGSSLVDYFKCIGITKYNYSPNEYRVFINANGNSSKLLPEKDLLLDFDLTVRNTLKSVIDFKFNTYVYLSSCEVYTDKTTEDTILNPDKMSKYAFSKYLAENIVKKNCKKWLILRLNAPINKNCKKGPIFDMLNKDKLWLSAKSKFQFLHTKYICQFIEKLLEKNITNEVYNLAGADSISLQETMVYLGIKVFAPENPVVNHNFCVDKANSIMVLPKAIVSLGDL